MRRSCKGEGDGENHLPANVRPPAAGRGAAEGRSGGCPRQEAACCLLSVSIRLRCRTTSRPDSPFTRKRSRSRGERIPLGTVRLMAKTTSINRAPGRRGEPSITYRLVKCVYACFGLTFRVKSLLVGWS